jgi:hypothetical protein
MTAPLYLNSDNNIGVAGGDWHAFNSTTSPGVTITTSWQKFHTFNIETAGYYQVRAGMTHGATSATRYRFARVTAAINGSNASADRLATGLSCIVTNGTSTDYQHAGLVWAGYLEANSTVDLWTQRGSGTGSGDGFIWSYDFSVEPWGLDNTSYLYLNSDNNIVTNAGKDWFYVNDSHGSVSMNTWVLLQTYTFKTSGRYLVESVVNNGANNVYDNFRYNRLVKNDTVSSPTKNFSDSLQGCGSNFVAGQTYYNQSYNFGVGDFVAGDTISLWTIFADDGSGLTTSPFVWQEQLCITPWAGS